MTTPFSPDGIYADAQRFDTPTGNLGLWRSPAPENYNYQGASSDYHPVGAIGHSSPVPSSPALRDALPDAYSVRNLEEQRQNAVAFWSRRVMITCALQIVRFRHSCSAWLSLLILFQFRSPFALSPDPHVPIADDLFGSILLAVLVFQLCILHLRIRRAVRREEAQKRIYFCMHGAHRSHFYQEHWRVLPIS
jgi:hypothetical protein